MRLTKRLLARLIPTSILIALAAFSLSNNAMASGSGDPLPEFSLETLNGNGHLTNRTLSGHVSLLNVWASWCSYCLAEHGMLMKIKNSYHIPIYGIDFRDDSNNARALLENRGNPYTAIGVDWNGTATDALDVSGTPVTFIVDKHGVIRYRYTGGIDNSGWNNDLLPRIRQYEAEK